MRPKLDKALVIDLEATCWLGPPPDGQIDEIIEIGICALDLRTLEPMDKRSFYVKPTRSEISEFCTELTGITQEKLDTEGMTLGRALKRLTQEYGPTYRSWYSWGSYDRQMLLRECQAKGLKYPFSDLHTNAKVWFSQMTGKRKGFGMVTALAALNLELEGTHHSGADDAWNTARIIAHVMRAARDGLTV